MKQRRLLWLSALVFPMLLSAQAAAPPSGEPPDEEERRYEEAIARRSLQENCLICHTGEMIESQRLTSAQWKAEVDKMVGWGAPLPKEQQRLLTDYLARQYPDRSPPAKPARMTYAEAMDQVRPEADAARGPAGRPERGATLYAVNCASCHGADAQGAELGPNIVEKPVLLRPTEYREVVGKGRNRMPGFKSILNESQERDVLAWLRQRRFAAPPPR